jgi:hypothetical protein
MSVLGVTREGLAAVEGKDLAQMFAAAPLMLEAINYVLEHPVTFVDNTVAAMLENARDTALGQNAEVSHGDRQRQPDTHSTHKKP